MGWHLYYTTTYANLLRTNQKLTFMIISLQVSPDWETEYFGRGVSVKGNTYFFATEKVCDLEPEDETGWVSEVKDFLLCFDFTRERFGPRMAMSVWHSHALEMSSSR